MPKRLCATVHFLLPFALPTRPQPSSVPENDAGYGVRHADENLPEDGDRDAPSLPASQGGDGATAAKGGAEADRTLRALLQALQTPGLDATIRRARRVDRDPGEDFQRSLPESRWLARQYGLPPGTASQDAPLAPYMLLADGGTPDPAAAGVGAGTAIEWACLELAHIEVTHDRLVLSHPQSLDIPKAEASALAQEMAASATARGLHFVAPTSSRWYLGDSRGGLLTGLQGASPLRAAGRSIDIWLPIDETRIDPHGMPARSSKWIGFQTELQMAWHEHPVNVARAARGARPVNAVWLHGRGAWPPAAAADVSAAPFLATFADSPAARGMALAANTPAAPLPADFAALMTALSTRGAAADTGNAGATPTRAQASDTVLVQSDALSVPMVHEAWHEWLDRFAVLDRQWFAPAIQALRDSTIDEIRLTLCGEQASTTLSLRRGDLWAFWRRRAFADLLT